MKKPRSFGVMLFAIIMATVAFFVTIGISLYYGHSFLYAVFCAYVAAITMVMYIVVYDYVHSVIDRLCRWIAKKCKNKKP